VWATNSGTRKHLRHAWHPMELPILSHLIRHRPFSSPPHVCSLSAPPSQCSSSVQLSGSGQVALRCNHGSLTDVSPSQAGGELLARVCALVPRLKRLFQYPFLNEAVQQRLCPVSHQRSAEAIPGFVSVPMNAASTTVGLSPHFFHLLICLCGRRIDFEKCLLFQSVY
jgi:hypothetical protein